MIKILYPAKNFIALKVTMTQIPVGCLVDLVAISCTLFWDYVVSQRTLEKCHASTKSISPPWVFHFEEVKEASREAENIVWHEGCPRSRARTCIQSSNLLGLAS